MNGYTRNEMPVLLYCFLNGFMATGRFVFVCQLLRHPPKLNYCQACGPLGLYKHAVLHYVVRVNRNTRLWRMSCRT